MPTLLDAVAAEPAAPWLISIIERIGPAAAAAVPGLVAALRGADAKPAAAAAAALGKTGVTSPEVIAALTEGLSETRDALVRVAAARALEALGDTGHAAAEALRASLSAAPPEVRLAFAKALWKLRGAAGELVPVLAELMAGAQPRLREAAIQALAEFGPAAGAAAPRLRELMGASDRSAQLAAAALWKIERTPEAVSALCRMLAEESGSEAGGWDLGRLLAEIGPPAQPALPELERAIGRGRSWAVAPFLCLAADRDEVLRVLTEAARENPDDGTRARAIEELGKLGPAAAAAAPVVERALRGRSANLRRAAEQALPWLRQAPAEAA